MNVCDILELKIDDFDLEGLGIAHYEGKPIFIDNAIPGEVVKFKILRITKNLCFAKNISIINKSSDREDHICKYYASCGGCNIMHMKYMYQLKFKHELTKRTLKKIIGQDIKVNPCVENPNPYGYRNKIIVPFKEVNGEIISGFYEEKSHNIVPSDGCMIEPSFSSDIIKTIKELLKKYRVEIYDEERDKGIFRNVMIRVSYAKRAMVVLVATKMIDEFNDISKELMDKYQNIVSLYLNINDKKTNVVLQDKFILLKGDKYIEENINGLIFKVHPNSFLQINHAQCERLYKKAIELASITKDDVVIDAYCGIGSISLNIAKCAKYVYGIEVVKEAVDNANLNMKLNNISNASFICGKCEDEIMNLVKNQKIDVMVFDPPRKGCDIKFLDTVIKSKIKRIVYISCKASTFARDLKILSENGYEISEVTPFDLFSHSSHVENVCLLTLKENN